MAQALKTKSESCHTFAWHGEGERLTIVLDDADPSRWNDRPSYLTRVKLRVRVRDESTYQVPNALKADACGQGIGHENIIGPTLRGSYVVAWVENIKDDKLASKAHLHGFEAILALTQCDGQVVHQERPYHRRPTEDACDVGNQTQLQAQGARRGTYQRWSRCDDGG